MVIIRLSNTFNIIKILFVVVGQMGEGEGVKSNTSEQCEIIQTKILPHTYRVYHKFGYLTICLFVNLYTLCSIEIQRLFPEVQNAT